MQLRDARRITCIPESTGGFTFRLANVGHATDLVLKRTASGLETLRRPCSFVCGAVLSVLQVSTLRGGSCFFVSCSGWLSPSKRRAVIIGFIALFALSSCDNRVDTMLSRLLQTEDEPVSADEASETTLAELEADVAEYRDAVNERFSAARNLASAHRMLGMRYLESDMYGPALEQFQKAADIQGGNATLFYYVGVSAANHAQSAMEEDEREQRYEIAERAYLRALELRDRYPDAAYGLAVLYAYELERPGDAREYIDKVLDWRSRDVRALAVSGYVYSQLGRIDEAIREYDAVIEHAEDEELRERARTMRQQLREGS